MSSKISASNQSNQNSLTSIPRLLDQNEVSPLIHKSVAWLERKRWEGGGILYRKVGRHVLYEESDVLAWIEKHPKRQSTSDTGKGVGNQ